MLTEMHKNLSLQSLKVGLSLSGTRINKYRILNRIVIVNHFVAYIVFTNLSIKFNSFRFFNKENEPQCIKHNWWESHLSEFI